MSHSPIPSIDVTPKPLELSWEQVGYASTFYFLNVLVSFLFHLELGTKLIIAALRCTLQLYFMGQILRSLFHHYDNIVLVLTIAVLLLLLGSFESYINSKYCYKHMYYVVFISMILSCTLICPLGNYLALGSIPWYNARIFIPTLGMVIGNSISGVALGVHSCLTGLKEKKDQLEMRFAFGATRNEALLPLLRESLQVALTPALNSMAVTGLISIPGQMTGQILAGAPIETAVHYQQILMFLLVSSTTLGTILSVLFTLWLLIDSDLCLRSEKISDKPSLLLTQLRIYLQHKFSGVPSDYRQIPLSPTSITSFFHDSDNEL